MIDTLYSSRRLEYTLFEHEYQRTTDNSSAYFERSTKLEDGCVYDELPQRTRTLYFRG